jgi:hypothetical protein
MERYVEILTNYMIEVKQCSFFVIKDLNCKLGNKWNEDIFVEFLHRICKRKVRTEPKFYCPLNKNDMVIFY